MDVVNARGRFIAAVGFLSLAGFVSGCGGGGINTVPVSATPPPLQTEAAFSATSGTELDTAPQSGGQIPVALPSGGGYSGTLSIPVPSGTIPPGTTLAESLTDTSADLPAGVPSLESIARQTEDRRTAQATTLTKIVLITLTSSVTLPFPNAPGLTISVPAADTALPNVVFWTALYDPLRPSLGWQRAFEGPATVSGTTLTFAAPSPAQPFTLTALIPEYFGVYALSSSAAAPTPAPSISPIPAPSPPPVFTVGTATMSLLAAGQSASTTISDPSGYTGTYGGYSSNPSVATVSVSGTTVTVTAAGPGVATIHVLDSQARSALIAVQVTTTTLPIQSEH